jgi:hypothetical protein
VEGENGNSAFNNLILREKKFKMQSNHPLSQYQKANLRTLPHMLAKEMDPASAGKTSGKCKGLRKRHCDQYDLRRTSV